MKKSRLLSAILCMSLLFGTSPAAVWADSDTPEAGQTSQEQTGGDTSTVEIPDTNPEPDYVQIAFTLIEGTENYCATLTGSGAVDQTMIEEYLGINNLYQIRDKVTKVIIGDGITSIEVYSAFPSMKELEIGPSVTTIAPSAFTWNSNLETVTLSEGLTTIDYEAFAYCQALKSISLPSTVTDIGSHAFTSSSMLTSVELNPGLQTIGEQAFAYTGLTSIEIPGSVEVISSYAFSDCPLTTATLNEGTRVIGEGAFRRCLTLASSNIPGTVTEIGKGAFQGCGSLTTLTVSPDASFTEIKEGTFSGCSFRSINIPDTVTNIGRYAFSGCSNLSSFRFPANLTGIEDNAFYNCNSLTSARLPEGLTYIGYSAFEKCISLSELTLPDTLTSIGHTAFKGTAITSVTIPDSLTILNYSTFQSCTSLTDVYVSSNLTLIASECFASGNNNLKIHIRPNPEYIITGITSDNGIATASDSADYPWIFTLQSKTSITHLTYEYSLANGNCARLIGHSLSLDGNIGINFYLELTEQAQNDPAAYMEFTHNDISSRIYVNEHGDDARAQLKQVNGKDYYVFTCYVAAKEMTDTITADFYVTSGTTMEKVASYSYSVTEYAYYFLNRGADETISHSLTRGDARELVIAMLNYGAACQEYFDYHTERLATAGLTGSQQNSDDRYDNGSVMYGVNRGWQRGSYGQVSLLMTPQIHSLPDNIIFYGMSLDLESATTLNLYFINNTGEDLTFTVNSATLPTYVTEDGYTVAAIENIPSSQLYKKIYLYISIGTGLPMTEIVVSPTIYFYNVCSREGGIYTPELQRVIQTMYYYMGHAYDYFDDLTLYNQN